MPHSPEEKKKALLRVRRIRGQTEALERALEEGADCEQVLHQLAAIRGGVNALMSKVFESHIQEEFGAHPDQGGRHIQQVQNLTQLVRTYLR